MRISDWSSDVCSSDLGRKYAFILDEPYRWESWAAPKDKAGKLDHNNALSGDDLRDFVNDKLFPYLHGFRQRASGPKAIEYQIGEIFGELKNRITRGYNRSAENTSELQALMRHAYAVFY